jgi:hypothetical protein
MGDVIKFGGRLGRDADRLKAAHDLVADVETSLRRPGEAWSGLWLLVRTAVVRLAHHLGAEQVARRLEGYAAELRSTEVKGVNPGEAGHDR